MHVRTFGILGEVVDRAHTVQSVRDIYRDLMMKPLYEESLIGAYSTIYQNLQPRFPGGERFECGVVETVQGSQQAQIFRDPMRKRLAQHVIVEGERHVAG